MVHSDKSSDLTDKTEEGGRGEEEDREGERYEERVEEMLERRDSREDLDRGTSMPSNFTLCLNCGGET